MLWGQRMQVFTNHKNLIKDAFRLTSDHVYWWRLLLEEIGPKTVHIKDIHNTVADTSLDYCITLIIRTSKVRLIPFNVLIMQALLVFLTWELMKGIC